MDKENLKPKQRRKSYRHFHDRRKNDVRKRQAKARETLSTLESNASISAITQKQPSPLQNNQHSPPRYNQHSPPRYNQRSPPRNNQRSPPRYNQRSPPRNNQPIPLRNNQRSPPRNNQRLEKEKKARKLIESEGVRLSREDAADIQTIMEENSDKVDDAFAEESFQHTLWEQQKKYNALKDKRQMRWHPLVIRFALSLRYASSTAYRTVSSSGLLSLPSERTLWDYTHWCSVKNGVHFAFIDRAKRVIAQEGFEQQDKQFALIMDEMKIKTGLVYRKHTGELVGFCDLGTVNQEFEELATAGECSNLNPTPKLAEHMLTFMIRSIFRPSLSFMIASYASLCLSGEKLYAPVWEVVEALEFSGLPVVSLTSDGASPNRRFYKLCNIQNKTYKTRNPFADRDLYFFVTLPIS